MAIAPTSRKLRGLIIVESDALWSSAHPSFAIVQSLKESLEELHVIVLSDAPVPLSVRLLHAEEKLFVYQFKNRWLLFQTKDILELLGFHLKWQGVFRADFILSLSESTAFFGYLLAGHYNRQFFVVSSVHILEYRGVSVLLARMGLRNAAGIFVPGTHSVERFSSKLHIPTVRLHSAPPSLDLSLISKTTEQYNFRKDHPDYTFFISGAIYSMDTLSLLMKVHAKVSARFPRAGLIVIADEAVYDRAFRKARRAYGVFVYKKNDAYLTYLKGTNIYLAFAEEQDVDTMMLTALALQISVVAGDYGIARELFPESRYAEFLCNPKRTDGIVNAVMKLIGDQYMRTEYGLNNPVLSGKVSSLTASEYVQKIITTIESVTRPVLVDTSATQSTVPVAHLPVSDERVG